MRAGRPVRREPAWNNRLSLGLATVTLLLAGVRLALSVRGIRSLSQERRRQSVTDELTGLGNRRHLNTVLDSFFADYDQAADGPRTIALLFVDLNHFKEVNDTFGHAIGDNLLKQLGPRLAACVSRDDLLIRLRVTSSSSYLRILTRTTPPRSPSG